MTKEPIVLDAEGKVIHDPNQNRESTDRPFGNAKIYRINSMGLLPKLVIGASLGALLFLGLTVAGIVLGVLFVGFLGKLLFGPFFKQTRR